MSSNDRFDDDCGFTVRMLLDELSKMDASDDDVYLSYGDDFNHVGAYLEKIERSKRKSNVVELVGYTSHKY